MVAGFVQGMNPTLTRCHSEGTSQSLEALGWIFSDCDGFSLKGIKGAVRLGFLFDLRHIPQLLFCSGVCYTPYTQSWVQEDNIIYIAYIYIIPVSYTHLTLPTSDLV